MKKQDVEMALGIMNQVTKEHGRQAAEEFLASAGAKLPPTKLTKEQMRFISGGRYMLQVMGPCVQWAYEDKNNNGVYDSGEYVYSTTDICKAPASLEPA